MNPVNYVTRQPYNGKNAQTLAIVATEFPTPEFLTFRQALNIGRVVRKGEHGTRILKVVRSENVDGDVRTGLRGYYVFNVAQTDELPEQPLQDVQIDRNRGTIAARRVA